MSLTYLDPTTRTPVTLAKLETAILRTLLYADIFDFPLTLAEINQLLIGVDAPEDAIWMALGSTRLKARLICLNGYYALRERVTIVSTRLARRQASAHLWPVARRWGRWLAALPFVRMVAVTGALALDNATPDDDIDYLIVTKPGRVWLARAGCVALVYAARAVGVRLCPNYVLAETALVQSPRDLYIAHELVQMVPVSGLAVHAALLQANTWTHVFLPRAVRPPRDFPDEAPRGTARVLQQLGERALGGWLGDRLERWERDRKRRKFSAAAQRSTAAQLDQERVKGHFDDHGRRIQEEFARRLAQQPLDLDNA